jgi:hypothetical protein
MVAQPDRIDGGVGGAGIHAVQRGEVAYVVDDSQIVVDGRVLRHVSDPTAQGGGSGGLSEHRD